MKASIVTDSEAKARQQLIRILGKKLRYESWKFIPLLHRAGLSPLADEMVLTLGISAPPEKAKSPEQHTFDFGSE